MTLWLVYRYVRGEVKEAVINERPARHFKNLLIVLAGFSVLAYTADAMENIYYLHFHPDQHTYARVSFFQGAKNLFYAGVIILLLLFLYLRFLVDRLSEIRIAVKASIISLLIIFLLVMLSTFMDQGSTVVIHLLQHPLSVAMVIVFVSMLAMICAHYPDYLHKYILRDRLTDICWHLLPVWFTGKLGMGLIWYERPPQQHESLFFEHFRKKCRKPAFIDLDLCVAVCVGKI